MIFSLNVSHVQVGSKYTCTVCGKANSTPSKLVQHMVVHTGERKFPCDICEKRFTQASALKRHRNSAHFSNFI